MPHKTSIPHVMLAGLLLVLTGMAASYFLLDKPAPIPAGRQLSDVVPLPKPRLAVYSDRECLARNLAFETIGNSHSREGIGALLARQEMEAIARVVFQRKELGKRVGYRDTVCEVVYQEGAFSWTYKLPRNAVPTVRGRWQYLLAVADELLAGEFKHHWPEANRCVTNYKRTDNRGVDKKPAKWFKKNTEAVAVYGDHTFSCTKKATAAAR